MKSTITNVLFAIILSLGLLGTIETKGYRNSTCPFCRQLYNETLEEILKNDNLWPPQLPNDRSTIDKVCHIWKNTYKVCSARCRVGTPTLGMNYLCKNIDKMAKAVECVATTANSDQCLSCQNPSSLNEKECNCSSCSCNDERFCREVSCIFQPGRCLSQCTKNQQVALFNYYSAIVESTLFTYVNTTTIHLFPVECHECIRFEFQPESVKTKPEVCEVAYNSSDVEPTFPENSRLPSNNHTVSVTCECVLNDTAVGLGKRLNLECIQYCYLPCSQRHFYRRPDQLDGSVVQMKENYYSCNLSKCQQQIGQSLFNPSTVISDWLTLSLDHTNEFYEVSLTTLGISQLSLFSNAHFMITSINGPLEKKLNFHWIIDESRLTFLKSYKPVPNRIQAIRLTHWPSLSPDLTTIDHLPVREAEINRTSPWGLVLLFDIPGGIVHYQVYFPEILKRAQPPKPPTAPLHQFLHVFSYGDVTAEIKYSWINPLRWNGMPVQYDVECYVTESSDTENPMKVQFDGNSKKADRWWSNIYSKALHVYSSTVYWHTTAISFWHRTKHPSDYWHLVFSCRVRAYNVYGMGPWSTYMASTFTAPSYVTENLLVVLEQFDKRKNTWHYGSTISTSQTTFKKLHMGNRVLIARRHNETKVLTIRENFFPVGCYDWIGDEWYVVVRRSATKSLWLSLVVRDIEPIEINYLVELFGQEPLEVCLNPEASTLYMTIKSLRKMKVMKMNTTNQKLENVEALCSNCSHIFDNVVSPAITCMKNGLLLHTNSGIWFASVTDCICYKTLDNSYLANDTVLSLPLYTKATVVSKFLFRFQQIFYHILTKEGRYHMVFWMSIKYPLNLLVKTLRSDFGDFSDKVGRYSIPSNSGTNTFKTYGVITRSSRNPLLTKTSDVVNIERDDLDNVPYYPSHVVTFDNKTVSHIWTFEEYRPPLLRHCLFPNVSVVSVEMQSSHVAAVLIELKWSGDGSCLNMSKPKITYELMYSSLDDVHKGEIETDTNVTCHSDECHCHNRFSCIKWSTGITADRQQTTVIIDDVESNAWIYVEITPQPSLGNYRELWYGDFRPLTHKSLFSSEYVEPNIILLTWLLSTLLPLLFALICLIAALYYFYTVKGYVYQQIQRLTRSQIKIMKEIGKGQFGVVSEATIHYSGKYFCWMYLPCFSDEKTQPAAIKTLNLKATDLDKKSFLEEAILLSKLDSDYIIKTLGICMDSRPITLALELMNGGSLKKYLQKEEAQQAVLTPDLFQIAIDICNGCLYLEQNGILHRDISAKNCLVNTKTSSMRPEIVKLADFGLAKDTRSSNFEYKEKTDNFPFPVDFTAPEGWAGNFFPKSDVWSFGVVLWEIFTWGAPPFGSCPIHPNRELHCPVTPFKTTDIHHLLCVKEGSLRNLSPPCLSNFRVNDDVYKIQDLCWKHNASERPNFGVLLKDLKDAKIHGSNLNLKRPVPHQPIRIDPTPRPLFETDDAPKERAVPQPYSAENATELKKKDEADTNGETNSVCIETKF